MRSGVKGMSVPSVVGGGGLGGPRIKGGSQVDTLQFGKSISSPNSSLDAQQPNYNQQLKS